MFASIIGLAWIVSIPARRYEKRTGKKLGRSTAAALMNTVNEIYAPSAHNATQVLEEAKVRREAIPAPEDKDFANKPIVIELPPTHN